MPKSINIKVTTIEAELEFAVPSRITGRELFDQVVKTLGLRETWYFGLQYIDNKGLVAWLKMQKKITSQDLKKEKPFVFHFAVKFFPEEISEELIQDVTQRMFYFQIRKAILNDTLYCPADTATLLASYACQVKYGDYEEGKEKDLMQDKLLPQEGVLDKYKLSTEEWISRIALCWKEHEDMVKDEAMLEYLKICQDLEMYGVNYFDIKNRKGTKLLMGVDALGINVYEPSDKLTPKIGFPWSEIRNISFNDRKFIIKPIDKKAPDFVFFTDHLRTNKQILALAIGNHELYTRRRKPDSIEVKQMRQESVEEKKVRSASNAQKLEVKKKLRENEETLRNEEAKLLELEKKIASFNEEMRRKEEEYERKRMQQEEELQANNSQMERLLEENNQTILTLQETEKERGQLSTMSTSEREKIGRAHAKRIETLQEQLEENKREREEVEGRRQVLRTEVEKEHSVEMQMMAHTQDRSEEYRQTQPEIDQNLQQKLTSLRADLDQHKDENKASHMDFLHAENLAQGKDKYKTLKQIRQGNTRSRIDAFEHL